MYTVLIPQDVNKEGKDFLLAHGYKVVVGSASDPETIKREVAGCHAILARTALYPAEVIAAGTQLKIIARYGVGTDNIDVQAAEAQGVYVTIAKNCNVQSVAEHSISLMLACAKHLVFCHQETAKGHWEVRNTRPTTELNGKTLGLAGLGAIGQATAQKAHFGLNMRVIGYDPYMAGAALPEYIRTSASLDELLHEADVISLHIPATEANQNLIDARAFSLMKPGLILVNTARGGIVNEDALYEALKSNTIAAAGMDVFAEEPAKSTNKLFTLPNIVLSPHNAGLSREAGTAMALSAAKAIHDVLSGNKPEYPINSPKI